ncbi:jg6981 [Pararge aegeria aegeria]|uniref:Jg6981 protein n=1 Tax=Pararge aegeria aegeria TaxID=348720 RepID=A0A8S4S931_9NEOP|nr:jg6981 [Pararge aegeria aegeria]
MLISLAKQHCSNAVLCCAVLFQCFQLFQCSSLTGLVTCYGIIPLKIPASPATHCTLHTSVGCVGNDECTAKSHSVIRLLGPVRDVIVRPARHHYRPGETITFWILALDHDLRLVRDEIANIALSNPAGTKVAIWNQLSMDEEIVETASNISDFLSQKNKRILGVTDLSKGVTAADTKILLRKRKDQVVPPDTERRSPGESTWETFCAPCDVTVTQALINDIRGPSLMSCVIFSRKKLQACLLNVIGSSVRKLSAVLAAGARSGTWKIEANCGGSTASVDLTVGSGLGSATPATPAAEQHYVELKFADSMRRRYKPGLPFVGRVEAMSTEKRIRVRVKLYDDKTDIYSQDIDMSTGEGGFIVPTVMADAPYVNLQAGNPAFLLYSAFSLNLLMGSQGISKYTDGQTLHFIIFIRIKTMQKDYDFLIMESRFCPYFKMAASKKYGHLEAENSAN